MSNIKQYSKTDETFQFTIIKPPLPTPYRLLSTTLRDRLYSTEDSDTETLTAIHSLCRTWFEAGAALATSSPLQLETLPAARKQRLSALYGDVRRGVAECLSEMWYSLGKEFINYFNTFYKNNGLNYVFL